MEFHEVEFPPDQPFRSVAEEMIRLAAEHGKPVECTFDGILHVVDSTASADTQVAMHVRALEVHWDNLLAIFDQDMEAWNNRLVRMSDEIEALAARIRFHKGED